MLEKILIETMLRDYRILPLSQRKRMMRAMLKYILHQQKIKDIDGWISFYEDFTK